MLTEDRTSLGKVAVGEWGGFLWVNIDSSAGPLRDYLEPAASMLDPFQLENMRCRWRKWIVFECNWKVAMEAFCETYHVPGTHPEFMEFGQFRGWGRNQGRHSNIGYDAPKGQEEDAAKLRLGAGEDPRQSTWEMQDFTWKYANTNTTQTLVDAARRLKDELPEGTPAPEVSKHWLSSARATDEARGVVWPTVDPQHTAQSGTSWQIFPNQQIGHAVNNMLTYQARPYGDDPGHVHLRGRGLRALSRRRSARDRVGIYRTAGLAAGAPAGFRQHGRRAEGHEERRLEGRAAQSLHGAHGGEPALQPVAGGRHGRAEEDRGLAAR